jgi:hypothetical protein
LKRTILANVLYDTLDDLVDAFRHGVARLTANRDKTGFLYDQNHLTRELSRRAA